MDQVLDTPVSPGNAINTAQHIWGYVNDMATDKVKVQFEKKVRAVTEGASTKPLKRLLWKLVQAHEQKYLMKAHYFKDLF